MCGYSAYAARSTEPVLTNPQLAVLARARSVEIFGGYDNVTHFEIVLKGHLFASLIVIMSVRGYLYHIYSLLIRTLMGLINCSSGSSSSFGIRVLWCTEQGPKQWARCRDASCCDSNTRFKKRPNCKAFRIPEEFESVCCRKRRDVFQPNKRTNPATSRPF